MPKKKIIKHRRKKIINPIVPEKKRAQLRSKVCCINCGTTKDLTYSGAYIRSFSEIKIYSCKACELLRIEIDLKCSVCRVGYLMWAPRVREMFCLNSSCLSTRLFGTSIQ